MSAKDDEEADEKGGGFIPQTLCSNASSTVFPDATTGDDDDGNDDDGNDDDDSWCWRGIHRWWFTRTSDFGGDCARCCAYSRVGGADRDGEEEEEEDQEEDDDDDESDADATAAAAAATDDDDEHATTTTLGGGGGGGDDDDDSSSAAERAFARFALDGTRRAGRRKYYYNQLTKKSTYEKPRELYTAKESFVFENCAWKATYDKTSEKYYYNRETKRRSGRLRRS